MLNLLYSRLLTNKSNATRLRRRKTAGRRLISNEASEIRKSSKIRKKREECTKEKVKEEGERHLNTKIKAVPLQVLTDPEGS